MKNAMPFSYATSTDEPALLEQSARLFLWGFRVMARHRGCDCPIAEATRQLYNRFRVGTSLTSLTSLDALVETFACSACTALELHSPSCPCVSESEMSLMRVMAEAQSAHLNTARSGFERWLPGLAADWALGTA